MSQPVATLSFLEKLRKSGLIPQGDFNAICTRNEWTNETSMTTVLSWLQREHYLTQFQVDRLKVGKYKGFVLGSYIILSQLGAGGMGQVYLAEHTTMRRFVALKVLPAPNTQDEIARERFLREARAAASLDHPNIVRVFDFNRDGKLLYLVMEFIEGASIQTLVDNGGKLPVSTAVDYARQAAFGLEHARGFGLVHRDIKPNNILVDRQGVVRVLDLGLVRIESETDSKLTAKIAGRSIIGTADYLAPEQAIDSSNVDIRADIYSLGATLYYMLAGHPMFPEGKAGQKLMWQQSREPTPIHELRPDVSVDLSNVIRKAISKKREDRYQTPQEFADALDRWTGPRTLPDSRLIVPPPLRPTMTKPGSTSQTKPARRADLAETVEETTTPTPSLQIELHRRIESIVATSDVEYPNTEAVIDLMESGEHLALPQRYTLRSMITVSLISALGVGFAFTLLLFILYWKGYLRLS